MFNSPILNLVILLSFTYFIGSLMLSAIHESIAAGLKVRGRDLKKTLQNLLNDPQWTAFVKGSIFKSQHIQSLMNNAKQFPSYIPAQNFVLTIIEQIGHGSYTAANITAGIANSPLPASMKQVLNDLWQQAGSSVTATQTQLAAFETRLENYYNNAMERATGWYKRKTRRMLLVIGFLLAALLNIDTIKITNDALNDKNKLVETVDNIVKLMPDLKPGEAIAITVGADTAEIAVTTDSSAVIKPDSVIKAGGEKIKKLQFVYNETGGYQMGYKTGKYFNDWWDKNGNGPKVLFFKLLGLLITCFALQLGSNYWFDLLNKTVNMRATGKKPVQ
jgi:hypothetical protein